MKRLMIAAALCLSLPGCATTGALSPAGATAAIDAVQARYEQARSWSALFLPYMPFAMQEKVRLAGAAVELALATARAAATLAERQAALKQAEAAADTYAIVSGN